MTRQESFKRRVRARMEKTGERYTTARRHLHEKSARNSPWTSDPEHSNDVIVEATGKGWEEWRTLIDEGPGRDATHASIADFVRQEHDIDGWWAQSVAVGYERITGIRLPHQMADGTFTAGKTKTVVVDGEMLRAMLYDDAARSDLFGGLETEIRSRPGVKVPRIGIGPGIAQVAIEARPDGRATVTIAHEKLPSPEDVEEWKAYWSDWLDAIDEE